MPRAFWVGLEVLQAYITIVDCFSGGRGNLKINAQTLLTDMALYSSEKYSDHDFFFLTYNRLDV